MPLCPHIVDHLYVFTSVCVCHSVRGVPHALVEQWWPVRRWRRWVTPPAAAEVSGSGVLEPHQLGGADTLWHLSKAHRRRLPLVSLLSLSLSLSENQHWFSINSFTHRNWLWRWCVPKVVKGTVVTWVICAEELFLPFGTYRQSVSFFI